MNKFRGIATSAVAVVLASTMSVVVGGASASDAATTISASSINSSYSAMKLLVPITAKGTGGVEVILPDTV